MLKYLKLSYNHRVIPREGVESDLSHRHAEHLVRVDVIPREGVERRKQYNSTEQLAIHVIPREGVESLGHPLDP